MGLLDDAIREHLDLKRRRGADPAEVERAEREALGPVRRGPEPELADGAPEEPAAYDLEAEQDWEEEFDDVEEFPAAPTDRNDSPEPPRTEHYAPPETPASEQYAPPGPPPLEPEVPVGPAPLRGEPAPTAEPLEDESFAEDHPADPDRPATPPPHPAPGPPASTGGETVEYSVEGALAGEGEKKGEDPLEETPEFLQDTPEHDRLWFEQRPPRDFDFDG